MPSFVSPGVHVIEKDISDYTPTINPSVVGVVGFADKGEPNVATLITSQEQLVRTFGRPSDLLVGQGIEGSLEILETTNQLWYVRAMDEGSASRATAKAVIGASPQVHVANRGFGVTQPLYLLAQVSYTTNAGDTASVFPGDGKLFSIPAGTAQTQAAALRSVIGGSLASDKLGVFWNDNTAAGNVGASNTGLIAASLAGKDVTMTLTGWTNDALSNPVAENTFIELNEGGGIVDGAGADLAGNDAAATPYTSKGYTFTTETLCYEVESLWEGAGYNQDIQPDGQVVGNAISVEDSGAAGSVFYVYEDGAVKESFPVSFGPTSFIENVINTGSTNVTSEVIRGNLMQGDNNLTSVPIDFSDTLDGLALDLVLGEGGVVGEGGRMEEAGQVACRFVKLVTGGAPLDGGNSGLENAEASLVGDESASPKTGIYALDYEVIPVAMAIVPGITTESVQNTLVNLAERTGDFLAVLGTPLGIGNAQKAIDWHNGQSDIRSGALNSSYAAIYYPSVKVFNPYYGKDIFMDAGVFGVRQMCFTDGVAESWFAPAGFSRGKLTKPTEVEANLSQGDRDALYSGGNSINPIVNFPQQGITIFGQRTAQRAPTALDRINVRRLMLAVKHAILAASRRFVFEPNDEITWEKIKAILDPLLDDMRRRRGITQFKVVCDETTNTPVRVDRNELWCKVMIKPTKTAEVIVFELNITNQSTNLSS
tara:strand:+ start:1480 stop:3609 length:2130 start_codon:yes stop_codon:yes gene_type:complete